MKPVAQAKCLYSSILIPSFSYTDTLFYLSHTLPQVVVCEDIFVVVSGL